MKRRLAIWILRRFPVAERREILREGLQDLTSYWQKEVISYLLYKYFPGYHLRRNPYHKEKDAI